MAESDGPSGTDPAPSEPALAQLERARQAFHDVNNSIAVVLTNWWVLKAALWDGPGGSRDLRSEPEALAIAADIDLAAERVIAQVERLHRVLEPVVKRTSP